MHQKNNMNRSQNRIVISEIKTEVENEDETKIEDETEIEAETEIKMNLGQNQSRLKN